MGLIQIIYVSTAGAEFHVDELDRILETSARNNQHSNVTGMLLYASGSFLQVLEGEEEAADEVFRRISGDARHVDLSVIERGPIDERSFGTWSMGFRRLGAGDESTHPAFAPFFSHGFDAGTIQARSGLSLDILRNFAANLR